jgi:hypothetical protein
MFNKIFSVSQYLVQSVKIRKSNSNITLRQNKMNTEDPGIFQSTIPVLFWDNGKSPLKCSIHSELPTLRQRRNVQNSTYILHNQSVSFENKALRIFKEIGNIPFNYTTHILFDNLHFRLVVLIKNNDMTQTVYYYYSVQKSGP